jgi:ComF family protein
MQSIMLHAFASLIQSVLDIVLPRKERIVRIDEYALEDILISPQEHEACDVQITTLMQYRSRAIEDLIRALKYDRSDRAAHLLAVALAEYLHEEIANLRAFSTLPIILIPVPLHTSRQRERGFNQVEKILLALPTEFHDGTLSRVQTDVLVRTRPTPQQTRLSRTERLRNVQGAFALRAAEDIRGTHIILVDDVTTTGATLAEAAKPLAGETVTILALAHA